MFSNKYPCLYLEQITQLGSYFMFIMCKNNSLKTLFENTGIQWAKKIICTSPQVFSSFFHYKKLLRSFYQQHLVEYDA